MNRNDEYYELLEKLDGVAVPEKCVTRAVRRRKINSFIAKPLASVAILFLAFVLLVNVSPSIAYALGDIPVIGGITRAVTFTTRSVHEAVENGYQQQLDMRASDGDLTAELKYLIADEKNVSFTFELKGDLPEKILPVCTYGSEGEYVKLGCEGNNSLMTAATKYVGGEKKYPDSGTLSIKIYEMIVPENLELQFTEDGGIVPTVSVNQPDEPLAEFSFDISVDKSSIGEVKHYDVYAALEVEGQTLLIKCVDMYPTCTEITVAQDESNTAWINRLDFNVRDDAKHVYLYSYVSTEDEAWDADSRVYLTESMYFSDTKSIEFCLNYCSFMDKGAMKTEIDLLTGELTVPTDVIKVVKAEKNGDAVYAEFGIPVEAQIDDKALEKLGTLTESEEDFSIDDPDPYWSKYEFRSDNYGSDKLKIDFSATGWFDSNLGRDVRLCTFDLPER